jgi:hypothetical protein
MNPALIQGTSVSLSLSDEFGLSELRSGFISMIYERKLFTYGLHAGSFGYSLYREWHGGGSVAFSLNEYRLGATILMDRVSVPFYGSGTAISVRLGSLLRLSEAVHLGIVGDRILIKRLGVIQTHVPTGWSAALSWKWIQNASVGLGVQSEVGRNPMGSLTIRWNPIQALNLSLAHEPSSGRWAVGLRLHINGWSVPFGGTFHGDLGWSRHIGASWRKGNTP